MNTKLRVKTAVGVVLLTVLAAFSLAGCSGLLDLFTPKGTVAGIIWDATTGNGLAGVEVTVVGHTTYHGTTDSTGAFSFEAPQGTDVLRLVLTGYVFNDVTVEVVGGETTTVDHAALGASPVLSAGEFRFVLTWGAEPNDLDSHLMTPNHLEVYFSDKTPVGAGASLDVDNTSGYGPETVTITDVQTGTYQYFVHNYSGTPDITTSGARVLLYGSSGLLATFDVPTTGTGTYWLVCLLDASAGTYTEQGTVTDTAPVASVAPALKIAK